MGVTGRLIPRGARCDGARRRSHRCVRHRRRRRAAASLVGREALGRLGRRRRRATRRPRGVVHVERDPPGRLRSRTGWGALLRGPRVVTERFDFVIIGAGASGEAAAHYVRARGASVALVERDLFGGTCAFWGCMPSKTLLHAAAVRAAGGDYPWEKASARRDYMIVREGRDYPDDSGHIKGYQSVGIVPIRGTAKLTGPRQLRVQTKEGVRELEAGDLVIAVGSLGKVPKLDGLAEAGYWTNKEGTSLRELPKSIAILGAGPSGTELAQVYARFGVRTTLVSPRQVNPTDHPKSSAVLTKVLRADGVDVRENARAQRVRPLADQAKERGIDAYEESSDLATSAKGYVSESEGHVSIVVDRKSKTVVGAFIAGPSASEAIHDAVLAIKLRVPLETLAQTIHAFPTVSRVLGGLYAKAALACR